MAKPLDAHLERSESKLKLSLLSEAKHDSPKVVNHESTKVKSRKANIMAHALRTAKVIGLEPEARAEIRKSMPTVAKSAVPTKTAPIHPKSNKSVVKQENKAKLFQKQKQNKQSAPQTKGNQSQTSQVKKSTNYTPINNAQTQLKAKPKTSQDVKKYQNELFEKLSKNQLSKGNSITDSMMLKLEATLKGVRQYMYNVLALDNIKLAEDDRSSILSDLAIIDGAIESGSSAEKLKATDLVFKTIRRFMSVDDVPDIEEGVFENLTTMLNWAKLQVSPTTIKRLGGPNDPRVEPDFIERVLVHMVPITDTYKQKLKDMGATATMVDELNNYVPGYSHDGYSDVKGLSKANDTVGFGSNLPTDYLGPKVYDAIIEDSIKFIREINESLIAKTLRMDYFTDAAKTTPAKTIDIAIQLYFYTVMNTAWKLILEQSLDIDDVISQRMALELARFSAVQPNDLVNIFLLSNRYILADDAERIHDIFKRVDVLYNKTLYNLVKPMFKEQLFTYTSTNSGYYLGNKRIGDHKFTVRIIPELVLPCPIHLGALDETDVPFVSGVKLYAPVYVENGTFDETTKQLKDLSVHFTNLLALHAQYLSITNFNKLVTDSRFQIDTELYFSTRATGYGAFSLTMPTSNLGNKGVQIARTATSVAGLYPDGNFGAPSAEGSMVIAHLSDHCSQFALGMWKTCANFLRLKCTSYRNFKKFIDNAMGISNHPMFGYTEALQPRSDAKNMLTKGINVKDPFALIQLVSNGNYTYLHRDTIGWPVYIAQDSAGDFDIEIVNINSQASVTKDGIDKLVKKRGHDHYPSPRDSQLRTAIDDRSGFLGYQYATPTNKLSSLVSNEGILQLEYNRSVLIDTLYGMQSIEFAVADPNSTAPITCNLAIFGEALKTLMTKFEDKELFQNSYVLEEVTSALFMNDNKKVVLWPMPATDTYTGFALLQTSQSKVNKDETKQLMEIFGMSVLYQLDANTPEVYEVGKSGLIGKVDTDVILITDRDIYPKTVKIHEL